MKNSCPGIYQVLDGVLFPTQIIVTKELVGQEHTWLKSLSGRLEKQELKDLLKQIDGLTHDFDKRLADAVLEVSVRANPEVARELKGDATMCQALLEIMEPEINKIVEKVAEERVDKEARETASNMLKFGDFSPEEIRKYIPRLSIEEIRMIAKKLAEN